MSAKICFACARNFYMLLTEAKNLEKATEDVFRGWFVSHTVLPITNVLQPGVVPRTAERPKRLALPGAGRATNRTGGGGASPGHGTKTPASASGSSGARSVAAPDATMSTSWRWCPVFFRMKFPARISRHGSPSSRDQAPLHAGVCHFRVHGAACRPCLGRSRMDRLVANRSKRLSAHRLTKT